MSSSNVSYASLPLFVPTIIAEMGTFSDIQSNGLSAPPYVGCFFFIIFMTYMSDRFKMRGPFCATAALIGAIGFIINGSTSTTGPRYFSVFLSVQIFASVALLLAWTANIHATESKRAGGYTVLATIGQCGPLLGKGAAFLGWTVDVDLLQARMSSQIMRSRSIGRVLGYQLHSACLSPFLVSYSVAGCTGKTRRWTERVCQR